MSDSKKPGQTAVLWFVQVFFWIRRYFTCTNIKFNFLSKTNIVKLSARNSIHVCNASCNDAHGGMAKHWGWIEYLTSLNTQSCIKEIKGVQDFCFWAVWAAGPVLKKKLGAFFHDFRVKNCFWKFLKTI